MSSFTLRTVVFIAYVVAHKGQPGQSFLTWAYVDTIRLRPRPVGVRVSPLPEPAEAIPGDPIGSQRVAE